jgi:hypothetical protein
MSPEGCTRTPGRCDRATRSLGKGGGVVDAPGRWLVGAKAQLHFEAPLSAMGSRRTMTVVMLTTTVLFIGLSVLGYGRGFFASPARTGVLLVAVAGALAALGTHVNLSSGRREDVNDRWNLAPLALGPIALAVLVPYWDGRDRWTIDGDVVSHRREGDDPANVQDGGLCQPGPNRPVETASAPSLCTIVPSARRSPPCSSGARRVAPSWNSKAARCGHWRSRPTGRCCSWSTRRTIGSNSSRSTQSRGI